MYVCSIVQNIGNPCVCGGFHFPSFDKASLSLTIEFTATYALQAITFWSVYKITNVQHKHLLYTHSRRLSGLSEKLFLSTNKPERAHQTYVLFLVNCARAWCLANVCSSYVMRCECKCNVRRCVISYNIRILRFVVRQNAHSVCCSKKLFSFCVNYFNKMSSSMFSRRLCA